MIRKKSWTTDFFSIQSKTYFNLEFALNSSGCNTFFAIDTIELNEGTCEQNGVEIPEIQLEHPSSETPVETSLSRDEAEVNQDEADVSQDEADVNQDDAVVLLEQSLKAQALSLVKTKKKVQENLALKRALVEAHATNNKLMSYIKEFQNLARRNIGHLSISGASLGDVTVQTSSLPTHEL
ncbi:hypothetical protein HDE_05981 [Halotydeus destructor]|nr:hypothetical protein HDE_05981 [Halotydeus destructor]